MITPTGRMALCLDHLTKFAARRLSSVERAVMVEKTRPDHASWQTGSCALCADPAALIFEDREGVFAFCRMHFIRYVLFALRPNEHGQLAGRLTPDQFLTRLSSKFYFEGAAERPYFEDLDDPAYSIATPL